MVPHIKKFYCFKYVLFSFLGLLKAVQDPKNHMADHTPRLYVPYADTLGVRFYTQVGFRLSSFLTTKNKKIN